MTNGLHEVEKGVRFLTKVGNFGKQSVTLTPGMIIGQANAHVDNTLLNVEEEAADEKEDDWHRLLDIEGLTEDQKRIVTKVLECYSHLWDGKRLGVLHGTKHRIETKGNPVFQHPYRAGPGARQAEKEEVERMLKLGVIEPSTAE